MTSPASPGKGSDTRDRPAKPARWTAAAVRGCPARRVGGFTLFEVIICLSLLVVLTGVVVVNLHGWRQRQQFVEAGYQFESLLRMARADAAGTGRRIRMTFLDDGSVFLEREGDPLTEPHVFSDYSRAVWAQVWQPDVLIVERCELVGPSSYRTLVLADWPSDGSGPARQTLQFFPDGSSDSAVIELRPVREEDERRMLVEIDGLAGTIRRQTLTLEGLEAYHAEAAGDNSIRR